MKLRISGIARESVVDGPGIRYVIFTQGCIHNCPGCHNPETHDMEGGYEMDSSEIIDDIKGCPHINGVTFSGGEPFLQAECLSHIALEVRKAGYKVVTYTGYTFEELLDSRDDGIKNLLEVTDILVDGKFILSEKDVSLKFRGSRNQRIIDVRHSRDSGKPVLMFK